MVDRETVAELVEAGGLVAATGEIGTGLIFVDTLVHGSPGNLSPWNRSIFSLILNPVHQGINEMLCLTTLSATLDW